MTRLLLFLAAALLVFVGLVFAAEYDYGPLVITREGQQKIVMLMGDPRRVTSPGLSLRIPLVESVDEYQSRLLYLSTEELPIQTRDGEYLTVDNYILWKIEDAIAFKRSFPSGMTQAEGRIDRNVRDDVREVIGRHTLTEVLKASRAEIMDEITERTRETLAPFGIGVADVRINRTELPERAEESVYARMKTERERLARRSRAEGEEKARTIRAEADRDAVVIVANAKRDAEIARGEGDAEATRIYAEAYSTDPEFYGFMRSLEAYRKTIGGKTTLVLSPKSEFFRFLESATPEGSGGTRPVSAPPR